jgi:hypothetical protein
MATTIRIYTQDEQLFAQHGDQFLASTPPAVLPHRAQAVAHPYEHGPAVFAPLGGDALLGLLAADSDRTLCLTINVGDRADACECAIMPPHIFLVHRYEQLRLADIRRPINNIPRPRPVKAHL